MNGQRVVAALLAVLALGAGPMPSGEVDSQVVLQRYAVALDAVPDPKAMVFHYTVSQAGPQNIEQHHIVYRSGSDVRDETISVDGVTLPHKIVQFSQREDRYAIEKMAPRAAGYQMLFLEVVKDGRHYDYVYEATPLIHNAGAWIDRFTIDGVKFLPKLLHFHTAGSKAAGIGTIEYGQAGKYWVPMVASAEAKVGGKPARERIVFSEYRFPDGLPRSAFQPPKPLPTMTLPPI
ncbi:MAG: hypothetical protein JO199_09565 [Candidatus Eremiobacteraeota bacterium]|nr:hypothetical protein [Candidatus Eremiobacteraeota bacterium]